MSIQNALEVLWSYWQDFYKLFFFNPLWETTLHLRPLWQVVFLERYHCIWVRSRNCGCLVTWFCYQLIAKPGNKTAAVLWPDPYVNPAFPSRFPSLSLFVLYLDKHIRPLSPSIASLLPCLVVLLFELGFVTQRITKSGQRIRRNSLTTLHSLPASIKGGPGITRQATVPHGFNVRD